jgi:hypothetical protein
LIFNPLLDCYNLPPSDTHSLIMGYCRNFQKCWHFETSNFHLSRWQWHWMMTRVYYIYTTLSKLERISFMVKLLGCRGTNMHRMYVVQTWGKHKKQLVLGPILQSTTMPYQILIKNAYYLEFGLRNVFGIGIIVCNHELWLWLCPSWFYILGRR